MENPAFLATLDPARETLVICDASQAAIAGTLFQLSDAGSPQLVALFSRALKESEARWPVFDLEALALVDSLKRWRYLLQTSHVVVLSDHKGLSCLFKDDPRTSGKAARWVETILSFSAELRHVPGRSPEIALADLLSRSGHQSREKA